MSISFVQLRKDLFSAEFQVICQGSCVGQLRLCGCIGTREGEWQGHVFGHSISMKPSCEKFGFRPYDIGVDGVYAGYVGMAERKSGMLSRFRYHRMCYRNRFFDLYPVGLGREGTAGCLYQENVQLAQIDKGTVVKDDLHNFEIFAPDQDSALLSVLLCCYMYVVGCYRPGETVLTSSSVGVSVTTNKVLKAKYDPGFKSRYRFL